MQVLKRFLLVVIILMVSASVSFAALPDMTGWTAEAKAEQVADTIKEEGLDSFVSAQVEVVDSIEMNIKTGKFKLIIPFCD